MRISAAARFGGVVDNEADCLCALRAKSASQVRRHAEAVYLWRRVRMGSVGRTRQLSSCLTSLCPSHVFRFLSSYGLCGSFFKILSSCTLLR